MGKVVEHAKAVHGLDPVPPEVAAKVKAAIRDV
jgi:predicted small metal-binding protein